MSWQKRLASGAVDGEVADLVDDGQPRYRVELELLLQPAFAERPVSVAIIAAAVVKSTR